MSNLDELRKAQANLKNKECVKCDDNQKDATAEKKCLIPDEIMDLINSGSPALVIVDNGSNVSCHTQRLAKPAAIGVLAIFEQKLINDEMR